MVSTSQLTLYSVSVMVLVVELCFCVILDCRLVHTSQRGRIRTPHHYALGTRDIGSKISCFSLE